MKNKNIILIIVGIILLGLIIYLVTKPEEKFINIKFTPENYVVNRTDKSYLDTIVHIGLKEMGISNITVLIREMETPRELEGGYETQGYIVSTVGGGNSYLIYVKKDFNRYKAIDILAHELIHIEQYHTKKLIWLGGDNVVWNNSEYLNFETIPYQSREWEKDAFDRASDFKKQLVSLLYE